MELIKKFFEDQNEDIKQGLSTALYFFNVNKKLVSKSEFCDLEQDIILRVIESIDQYDQTKGMFSTFLNSQLRKLKNDFITRYTGITVPFRYFRSNKNIRIYLVEFEEN